MTKRWEVMAPDIATLSAKSVVVESKKEIVTKSASRISTTIGALANQYERDLENTTSKLILRANLQKIVDHIDRKCTE